MPYDRCGMAMACQSAPASIPNNVGAITLSKVSRQVADRGPGPPRSFGGDHPPPSCPWHSSTTVVYDPSSPIQDNGADDELNPAGLHQLMGKGRIVAGCIAPHPPHLVYAENPPSERAGCRRRLGTTALGLRTLAGLAGRQGLRRHRLALAPLADLRWHPLSSDFPILRVSRWTLFSELVSLQLRHERRC